MCVFHIVGVPISMELGLICLAAAMYPFQSPQHCCYEIFHESDYIELLDHKEAVGQLPFKIESSSLNFIFKHE